MQQFLPRGRRRYAAVAVLIVVSSLIATFSGKAPGTSDVKSWYQNARDNNPSPFELQAGFLHVIMPVTHTSKQFCRTTLSTALLGYPVPELINWQRQQSEENGDQGGDEYGYLKGALKQLKDYDQKREDDLVLLVNGYDTWFQLRPQILIDRYRSIVKDANKRTYERLGNHSQTKNIDHGIVFAAQKQCSEEQDAVGCFAVPKSSLPSDVYGSGTDVEDGKSRPRYLHTGIMMGNLKAMRTLLEHALEKGKAIPGGLQNEQALFADIFGEQEYAREYIRSKHLSSMERLSKWMLKTQSIIAQYPNERLMQTDGEFEYGITLDYEGSLGKVVEYDHHVDSDFFRYADGSTFIEAASKLNASARQASIQRDVELSRPPFWSLARVEKEFDLPSEMAWENMPLYSNVWTGVTPAIIYHNTSDPSGLAFDDNWHQLWFQPYARQLLQAWEREPRLAFASETVAPNIDKMWWGRIQITPIDKGRVGFGVVEQDKWLKWTEICAEEDQDAVFADKQGKWVDPIEYPPFPDLHPEMNQKND